MLGLATLATNKGDGDVLLLLHNIEPTVLLILLQLLLLLLALALILAIGGKGGGKGGAITFNETGIKVDDIGDDADGDGNDDNNNAAVLLAWAVNGVLEYRIEEEQWVFVWLFKIGFKGSWLFADDDTWLSFLLLWLAEDEDDVVDDDDDDSDDDDSDEDDVNEDIVDDTVGFSKLVKELQLILLFILCCFGCCCCCSCCCCCCSCNVWFVVDMDADGDDMVVMFGFCCSCSCCCCFNSFSFCFKIFASKSLLKSNLFVAVVCNNFKLLRLLLTLVLLPLPLLQLLLISIWNTVKLGGFGGNFLRIMVSLPLPLLLQQLLFVFGNVVDNVADADGIVVAAATLTLSPLCIIFNCFVFISEKKKKFLKQQWDISSKKWNLKEFIKHYFTFFC